MTTATAKTPAPAKAAKKITMKNYIESVGRRKTAVARVRLAEASKFSYVVNGKALEEYFGTEELRGIVIAPLTREGAIGKYDVSVVVNGGGVHAQAEAIRLGISRAIVKEDINLKGDLKKLGFLKRDSRKVERKHFGLKKARKASQWSKR
jgi:small subunit ribosomal protein S9